MALTAVDRRVSDEVSPDRLIMNKISYSVPGVEAQQTPSNSTVHLYVAFGLPLFLTPPKSKSVQFSPGARCGSFIWV